MQLIELLMFIFTLVRIKKMKRKLNLGIMTSSLVLLTITGLKKFFFPDWTFTSPEVYNSYYSISFCSMVGLLGSAIVIWKKNWLVVELIITLSICSLIFYGQFNPIDTTTFPRDKTILAQQADTKLVIVEYKNCKTNQVYQDTLKVYDKWIFRKIEK